MSRLLTGLLGKGIKLTRALGTRPKFCQETGVYVHPETRRTFPIVYKWMELHPSERTREGESFEQWSKSQRKYFSDMNRWAEFRRKMAYGIY